MIPKFRAWIYEDEEMAKVDAINFLNHEVELSETTEIIEASINEVELMQSTGYADKNHKEIFIGDQVIGRSHYQGGGVWGYETKVVINNHADIYELDNNSSEIEIIGNIYESEGNQ